MEYQEFLENKKKVFTDTGFDAGKLNPLLKDFQAHCVRWALKRGRAAFFHDCGLGKTFQQLEWANQVVKFTGLPVLILAPLAVTGQTIMEGDKFGIEVSEYLPGLSESKIYITNYEQIENVDTSGKARYFVDAMGGGNYEKRQENRSKTFPGIANAMADQWGIL